MRKLPFELWIFCGATLLMVAVIYYSLMDLPR